MPGLQRNVKLRDHLSLQPHKNMRLNQAPFDRLQDRRMQQQVTVFTQFAGQKYLCKHFAHKCLSSKCPELLAIFQVVEVPGAVGFVPLHDQREDSNWSVLLCLRG